MKYSRIPFHEAMSAPELFNNSWKKLSSAQKVLLRSIYNLGPEDDAQREVWAALTGQVEYDHLGFLVKANNPAQLGISEYEDITLILGRRWGKTSQISSLVCAYEALCGGHKQYVGDKQDVYILQVSQDLDTAKSCLRQFILEHLLNSPVGRAELGNLKQSVTADSIRLKTALITVGPPTIKLRGQAVAVCAMDEIGVWKKDTDSANPDFEVERAVRPAMMQFPHRKLIKTSTPWIEEGLLWAAKCAAEEHKLTAKQLVLSAPTALSGNPHCSREFLQAEFSKDPEAFAREYLVKFAKSVSGFLSPTLIRQSASHGLKQRSPIQGQLYIAAIDPAFRGDAFAFTILHMNGDKVEQDFITQWQGSKQQPISPLVCMQAVAAVCNAYGIKGVMSDQHHLDSLQELAEMVGLYIEPSPITGELKAKMWGEMAALLATGRISLLQHDLMLDQISKMEKRLTPGGAVQFTNAGAHDDLAMVTALAVHRCLQLGPIKPAASPKKLFTLSDMYWEAQRQKGRGKHREETTPWWA